MAHSNPRRGQCALHGYFNPDYGVGTPTARASAHSACNVPVHAGGLRGEALSRDSVPFMGTSVQRPSHARGYPTPVSAPHARGRPSPRLGYARHPSPSQGEGLRCKCERVLDATLTPGSSSSHPRSGDSAIAAFSPYQPLSTPLCLALPIDHPPPTQPPSIVRVPCTQEAHQCGYLPTVSKHARVPTWCAEGTHRAAHCQAPAAESSKKGRGYDVQQA